jgi:Ser/Thr protein kinase RdoA (MazF antagonist)
MQQSAWGTQETQYFYSLTPERILDAVERSLGVRCTGRSMAHASMENRVYEIELDLEDRRPRSLEHLVIAKFYRPGRWTREQILEEHRFLQALEAEEIPVVAPKLFVDGATLHTLPDAPIHYAVFPKVGGRSPQELQVEELEQIGRLLARMHNVGQSMQVGHRLKLTPDLYLHRNLQYLLEAHLIPETYRSPFHDLGHRLLERMKQQFLGVDSIQIHGDCHLGNLLQNGPHFFWLDFDDTLLGPAVQDLWLLLPGRDAYAKQMLQHVLAAYEQMRPFPHDSLRLIESLRALRMIHFAAWIGHRRDDPAFQRAFPDYGTDRYWGQLYRDLADQEAFVQSDDYWLLR